MKFNKIAILHVIIILFVWTTPLWLNWKLIALYGILNLLQIKIFGGCVVSQYQFKNKKEGFYRHYINKYFPNNKIKENALNLVLDYIIPIFLIISGYIIQN